MGQDESRDDEGLPRSGRVRGTETDTAREKDLSERRTSELHLEIR